MDRSEFMGLIFKIVPQEIIDEHNIMDIKDKGRSHIKSLKRMYDLPQAGKIANNLLKRRLIEAHYQLYCLQ